MFQLRLAGRVVLRLLLAALAIVAAVQAFRLVALPAVVSLLDLGEASTSIVRRIGIFACAIAAYWAYCRVIEKRRVDELRPSPLGVALGAATGAGLVGFAALLLFAAGAYEIVGHRGLQPGLLGVGGLIVVAATLEEIVYRGVLFRTLEQAWGTAASLVLQSLLFGFGHLENLDVGSSTADRVATVASVTLCGALWTMVFVVSRNLWATAANHAAWNFTIVLTGAPLSGLEDWLALAPLASRYRGPDWLTGGQFGPEASAVTMVLMSAAVVASWKFAYANGRLVRATRPRVRTDTLLRTEPG